jgi:uncharacterized protein (UPF0332 family)
MSREHPDEIAANRERAKESIGAAEALVIAGYYDSAASRAYYAAFYAATAALLREGIEFKKHSGVVAGVHERLVRAGKLDKASGRDLNWLFDLRGVGDYGVTTRAQERRGKSNSGGRQIPARHQADNR